MSNPVSDLLKGSTYPQLLDYLSNLFLTIETQVWDQQGRTFIKENYIAHKNAAMQEAFQRVSQELQGLNGLELRVLHLKEYQLLKGYLKEERLPPLFSMYKQDGNLNLSLWQEVIQYRHPNETVEKFLGEASDQKILRMNASARDALGASFWRGRFAQKALLFLTSAHNEIHRDDRPEQSKGKKECICLEKTVFENLTPLQQKIVFKDIFAEAFSQWQIFRGTFQIYCKNSAVWTYVPASPRDIKESIFQKESDMQRFVKSLDKPDTPPKVKVRKQSRSFSNDKRPSFIKNSERTDPDTIAIAMGAHLDGISRLKHPLKQLIQALECIENRSSDQKALCEIFRKQLQQVKQTLEKLSSIPKPDLLPAYSAWLDYVDSLMFTIENRLWQASDSFIIRDHYIAHKEWDLKKIFGDIEIQLVAYSEQVKHLEASIAFKKVFHKEQELLREKLKGEESPPYVPIYDDKGFFQKDIWKLAFKFHYPKESIDDFLDSVDDHEILTLASEVKQNSNMEWRILMANQLLDYLKEAHKSIHLAGVPTTLTRKFNKECSCLKLDKFKEFAEEDKKLIYKDILSDAFAALHFSRRTSQEFLSNSLSTQYNRSSPRLISYMSLSEAQVFDELEKLTSQLSKTLGREISKHESPKKVRPISTSQGSILPLLQIEKSNETPGHENAFLDSHLHALEQTKKQLPRFDTVLDLISTDSNRELISKFRSDLSRTQRLIDTILAIAKSTII